MDYEREKGREGGVDMDYEGNGQGWASGMDYEREENCVCDMACNIPHFLKPDAGCCACFIQSFTHKVKALFGIPNSFSAGGGKCLACLTNVSLNGLK